jgi:hypothetical protein
MMRSEQKRTFAPDAIYPTGIFVDISAKLPKSVSNFLVSGFRILGRVPVT